MPEIIILVIFLTLLFIIIFGAIRFYSYTLGKFNKNVFLPTEKIIILIVLMFIPVINVFVLFYLTFICKPISKINSAKRYYIKNINLENSIVVAEKEIVENDRSFLIQTLNKNWQQEYLLLLKNNNSVLKDILNKKVQIHPSTLDPYFSMIDTFQQVYYEVKHNK